jgi:hypothetical protein
MTVPESISPKVPAKSRRGRRPAAPQPPRYLTGDPSSWRFQRRLSPTFFGNGILAGSRLAGSGGIVRATLGPRRRGEVKRLALQLASLCLTICSFAADTWKGTTMEAPQFDDRQNELVRNTVAACAGVKNVP